jgi:hypothetical protein
MHPRGEESSSSSNGGDMEDDVSSSSGGGGGKKRGKGKKGTDGKSIAARLAPTLTAASGSSSGDIRPRRLNANAPQSHPVEDSWFDANIDGDAEVVALFKPASAMRPNAKLHGQTAPDSFAQQLSAMEQFIEATAIRFRGETFGVEGRPVHSTFVEYIKIRRRRRLAEDGEPEVVAPPLVRWGELSAEDAAKWTPSEDDVAWDAKWNALSEDERDEWAETDDDVFEDVNVGFMLMSVINKTTLRKLLAFKGFDVPAVAGGEGENKQDEAMEAGPEENEESWIADGNKKKKAPAEKKPKPVPPEYLLHGPYLKHLQMMRGATELKELANGEPNAKGLHTFWMSLFALKDPNYYVSCAAAYSGNVGALRNGGMGFLGPDSELSPTNAYSIEVALRHMMRAMFAAGDIRFRRPNSFPRGPGRADAIEAYLKQGVKALLESTYDVDVFDGGSRLHVAHPERTWRLGHHEMYPLLWNITYMGDMSPEVAVDEAGLAAFAMQMPHLDAADVRALWMATMGAHGSAAVTTLCATGAIKNPTGALQTLVMASNSDSSADEPPATGSSTAEPIEMFMMVAEDIARGVDWADPDARLQCQLELLAEWSDVWTPTARPPPASLAQMNFEHKLRKSNSPLLAPTKPVRMSIKGATPLGNLFQVIIAGIEKAADMCTGHMNTMICMAVAHDSLRRNKDTRLNALILGPAEDGKSFQLKTAQDFLMDGTFKNVSYATDKADTSARADIGMTYCHDEAPSGWTDRNSGTYEAIWKANRGGNGDNTSSEVEKRFKEGSTSTHMSIRQLQMVDDGTGNKTREVMNMLSWRLTSSITLGNMQSHSLTAPMLSRHLLMQQIAGDRLDKNVLAAMSSVGNCEANSRDARAGLTAAFRKQMQFLHFMSAEVNMLIIAGVLKPVNTVAIDRVLRLVVARLVATGQPVKKSLRRTMTQLRNVARVYAIWGAIYTTMFLLIGWKKAGVAWTREDILRMQPWLWVNTQCAYWVVEQLGDTIHSRLHVDCMSALHEWLVANHAQKDADGYLVCAPIKIHGRAPQGSYGAGGGNRGRDDGSGMSMNMLADLNTQVGPRIRGNYSPVTTFGEYATYTNAVVSGPDNSLLPGISFEADGTVKVHESIVEDQHYDKIWQTLCEVLPPKSKPKCIVRPCSRDDNGIERYVSLRVETIAPLTKIQELQSIQLRKDKARKAEEERLAAQRQRDMAKGFQNMQMRQQHVINGASSAPAFVRNQMMAVSQRTVAAAALANAAAATMAIPNNRALEEKQEEAKREAEEADAAARFEKMIELRARDDADERAKRWTQSVNGYMNREDSRSLVDQGLVDDDVADDWHATGPTIVVDGDMDEEISDDVLRSLGIDDPNHPARPGNLMALLAARWNHHDSERRAELTQTPQAGAAYAARRKENKARVTLATAQLKVAENRFNWPRGLDLRELPRPGGMPDWRAQSNSLAWPFDLVPSSPAPTNFSALMANIPAAKTSKKRTFTQQAAGGNGGGGGSTASAPIPPPAKRKRKEKGIVRNVGGADSSSDAEEDKARAPRRRVVDVPLPFPFASKSSSLSSGVVPMDESEEEEVEGRRGVMPMEISARS